MKKILCLFAVLLVNNPASSLPAFPTAEGFGKDTRGGRGGIVVEVTNLNDNGAGSLREALTGSANAGKKRTIVFRMGGTIALASQITVKNDSCITLAGQTAPGGGIAIRNFPLYFSSCKEIIVRHFRSRLGDEQPCDTTACDLDAFSIRKCHHLVLDHCSFSWAIDAILDLTVETGYSTVQFCMLSEALYDSKHSKGPHSMAAGWDGNSHGDNNIFAGGTYHHNLLASCNSRMPRLDSYAGENDTGSRDLMDVVNNVIYNWAGHGAYGGEHADANWRNNYYKYGPSTGANKDQIFEADSLCKLYLAGNYQDGYPDITNDNRKGIYYNGVKALSGQLDTILKQTPFGVVPIAMETAQQAYASVLASAGATCPRRDTVDKRIVGTVTSRSGAIINSQNAVGGWPVLVSSAAPADTDHDGMPDNWETKHGLDPANPADRNDSILSEEGYTNLEMYLNELAGDPVIFRTTRAVPSGKTTWNKVSYESHRNSLSIEIPWEGSLVVERYDVAGRIIETVFNGRQHKGRFSIRLPGKVNNLGLLVVRFNGMRYVLRYIE